MTAALIDRAIASARREAYHAAVVTTTAQLRKGASDYAAECGPATGEQLSQLRMLTSVIRKRAASRTRAMQDTRDRETLIAIARNPGIKRSSPYVCKASVARLMQARFVMPPTTSGKLYLTGAGRNAVAL